LLHLLLIGVDVTHLFGCLLQQLRCHADVFHSLSSRGHALQYAQAISLIGDRDIRNFILEALTRSVENVDPFFSQAFPLTFVGSFAQPAGG
jgi:hypothetical protein